MVTAMNILTPPTSSKSQKQNTQILQPKKKPQQKLTWSNKSKHQKSLELIELRATIIKHIHILKRVTNISSFSLNLITQTKSKKQSKIPKGSHRNESNYRITRKNTTKRTHLLL